jgi:tetratricopeptide (TPR) repeat protein
MDAEVWYGLGDAYFHDPAGGDEVLRNRNASIRAFSRTLALDSTLHLAYPHLLALYSAAANSQAGIVLSGDTLIALSAEVRKTLGADGLAQARNASGQRAIAAARNWVRQDPDAREAYEALASANASAGQYSAAADAMHDAMRRPGARSGHFAYDIAFYELLAGEPKQALESLNSAIKSFPAESIKATSGLGRFASLTRVGAVAVYSGKMSLMAQTAKIAAEADPELPAMLVGPTSIRTEEFLTPWVALNKAALGIDYAKVRGPVDAYIKKFDAVYDSSPIQSRQANLGLVMSAFMITGDTTYLGYLQRWSRGMPGAPTSEDASPAFMKAYIALQRGDTAAAQKESREFSHGDTIGTQIFGQPFMEAEVLASLGDLRGAAATYESITPRRFNSAGIPDPRWALYARTFAARGRLYEELGQRDKAIENYQRFVDLWADADAALQPQVAAARASIAQLRDASSATSIVR